MKIKRFVSRFIKGAAFAAAGALAVSLVVGSGGLAGPLILAGAVGGGLFGNKIVDKISSFGPIAKRLEARRDRKADEKARFDEIKQRGRQRKLDAKADAQQARKQAREDLHQNKIDAKANAYEEKIQGKADAYEQKINGKVKAYEAKKEAKADSFNARLTKQFNPVAALKGETNARILPDFAARRAPVIKNHTKAPAARKL